MPNWCDNTLTVSGKEEDVNAFVEKAKGYGWQPENQGNEEKLMSLDCNQFVPMPKEVIENGYNGKGNLEGVMSGYDWETITWGTKWGACNCDVSYMSDTNVYYSFQTAWRPCDKVIYAMIKQYPKLEFHLDYAEYGMMFKGSISGFDGELKAETCEAISLEEVCEMGWHDGSEQENSEGCDACHDYCLKNGLTSDREPPIEEQIRIEIKEDWNNEKTI